MSDVIIEAAKLRLADLNKAIEVIEARLEQIRQAKALEVDLRKQLDKNKDEAETLYEALKQEE